MKTVTGVLLCVALLVSSPAAASGLTAEQILSRVSETYRALRSVRLAGRMSFEATLADPRDRTEIAAFEVEEIMPGMVRLRLGDQGEGPVLVSDGETTRAYLPARNQYLEARAAPLLPELWSHVLWGGVNAPVKRPGPSGHVRPPKLEREEILNIAGDSVKCYVVTLSVSGLPEWLWVDEARFIVWQHRWFNVVIGPSTTSESPILTEEQTLTLTLRQADTGPVPENEFKFTPPVGARLVDAFDSPPPFPWWTPGLAYSLPGLGPPPKGQGAPDFGASNVEGATVRLGGLHGKIVVLDFWASWCKPCQGELAALQKLHDEYSSKGVVFLGIDDESPDTVKSFVQAGGYTFPMLLDSDQAVHQLYGVRWAPTTVIIDRKGKIADLYVGAGGEAQLRRALKSAGLDTKP